MVAVLVTLLMVGTAVAEVEPLDTSGYAGRWSNKHFQLRLTDDGHAVAEFGLAVWCGPAAPRPCDEIDQDGTIQPGGLAALTFTEAREGALAGRVDWSTSRNGTLTTGEPIVLRFRADGTAELGSEGERVRIRLCGTSTAGQCGF